MDQKRTLYVSDLDGTLLTAGQSLSSFTAETINTLVDRGMIFSYATARSYTTASRVTRGISPRIPVIVCNGAFIREQGTQRELLSHYFQDQETFHILHCLTEHHISPIVYSHIDREEKFSYCSECINSGMGRFLEDHKSDTRANPTTVDALCCGKVFNFVCIDRADILLPAYELLKDQFHCSYYQDIYSNDHWLEILPWQATKAQAILSLKSMLQCERVVCFGDGKNDISMFEISDECYAVENAAPELKAMATAVIDSNECDGVAKWLLAHYGK